MPGLLTLFKYSERRVINRHSGCNVFCLIYAVKERLGTLFLNLSEALDWKCSITRQVMRGGLPYIIGA
jgi:hypothetical protein